MENLFCITKKELIRIFFGDSADDRMSSLSEEFSNRYSLQEVVKQMETQKGEIAEYIKRENEKFGEKTANAEIVNSIILADFYFLNSNPVICFEMKRGFRKKEIKSCKELIDNMESDTEIDCLIKDKHRKFKFQLKQYPEKYKDWNSNKIIEYLDTKILPKEKYNNESNKNLIIVITIKPELRSNFKEIKDFNKIHKYLKDKKVKLAEINFLYNKNCKHMIWFQVFPEKGYWEIPWKKLSYHQAKMK